MKSTAYPFWSMPSGGRFTKLPDYYQDYQNEMKRKKEEFEEEMRQRDRERWRHFDPFGDFGRRSHPCDFQEEEHDYDYPFSVFGLKKSASQEDMKRAYRDAVRSTHPDKTGSDTEDEFREVQEAYEYYRRYHL
tara:strand:- start:2390 stop:2788 length:399 start_codon:yes stop_codon:yes gene_type:complete